MFENILVPFDLSSQSAHAFSVAVDVAKKYGSDINLLTCIEKDAWRHVYYDSRADEDYFKKQKKEVEKQTSILKNDDVTLNSKIVECVSTVHTILSYAKEKNIDLVVMGSHGRTGFDKFILGSVANGVVQKSDCPVLIVK